MSTSPRGPHCANTSFHPLYSVIKMQLLTSLFLLMSSTTVFASGSVAPRVTSPSWSLTCNGPAELSPTLASVSLAFDCTIPPSCPLPFQIPFAESTCKQYCTCTSTGQVSCKAPSGCSDCASAALQEDCTACSGQTCFCEDTSGSGDPWRNEPECGSPCEPGNPFCQGVGPGKGGPGAAH